LTKSQLKYSFCLHTQVNYLLLLFSKKTSTESVAKHFLRSFVVYLSEDIYIVALCIISLRKISLTNTEVPAAELNQAEKVCQRQQNGCHEHQKIRTRFLLT